MSTSEGQYRAGAQGGVAQVGLQADVLRQTGHGLILLDCTNAFSSMKRTEILAEVAHRAQSLASFTASCFWSGRGVL